VDLLQFQLPCECCIQHPLSVYFFSSDNCGKTCVKTNKNYLGIADPGIGAPLLIMCCQGVFWFTVVLFVDSGVMIRLRHHRARRLVHQRRTSPVTIKRKPSIPSDDLDVIEERNRIMSTPLSDLFLTDCLIVKNMSRKFAGFHAVSRLSFGVQKVFNYTTYVFCAIL